MNTTRFTTTNRLLALFLILTLLLTAMPLHGPAFAAGTWETVGTAGFSAGPASYESLALDSSGVPYVAYRDDANSGKVTVMKYNGTSWETVGTAGFSAGEVWFPSLALDNSNTPYVAYRDGANSNKATVMTFNGSSWENVGTAGFSAGTASYESLALDSSGVPYVGYEDEANGSKATVMTWNGTSWVPVGIVGFSEGGAYKESLALDNSGTPYVAYRDDANSGKITVMTFNGTSWENVGIAGFSEGWESYDSCLALDSSGAPYVSYMDAGSLSHATVMTYNGASWEPVGAPGFSAGAAWFTSLALDSSDIPYVAYRDGGNDHQATVMRFNGASWEPVGTPGFSIGEASHLSLALYGSTAYVAYQDHGSSHKATVMKFEPPLPEPEIEVSDGETDIPSDSGSVDFGTTPLGTPMTKTFTVMNTGGADLTLTEPIEVPTGFMVAASFGDTTLAPSESTTFTIELDETATGSFSGEVSFVTNDLDENLFNFAVYGSVEAVRTRLLGTIGSGPGTSILVELDPLSGEFLQAIGTIGYRVNGLDYDPVSGNLYATTSWHDASFPNGLLTIDMDTGAGTPVGTGLGLVATNIRVDASGDLFAWAEVSGDGMLPLDSLVTIDPVTGTARVVSITGISTWEYGMSFDALGTLYLVNGDGTIYTINTTTGAVTDTGIVAGTGQRAHHGDFHPNTGEYWGIDHTGDHGGVFRNLLVIDVSTGTVQPPLPTVNNLHTLAFVPGSLSDPEIQVLEGTTGLLDGSGAVYFGFTGSAVTKTFTVRNHGVSDLTLSEPITVPAGFAVSVSFGDTTLAPSESTTFQITMDASAAGNPGGEVSFGTNDPNENPFNFNLHGMAPESTVLFGTVGNAETGASTLVALDPVTGELLGRIGDVGYLVTGLEYDPISDNLYATAALNDVSFRLLIIDMQTGSGTPIGSGSGITIDNIRADPAGNLFAMGMRWGNSSELVAINATTGAIGSVGTTGVEFSAHGMSFQAGTLYLVNGNGGIYTINTTSGAASYTGKVVGSNQMAHHGDFHPDTGKYWGIDTTNLEPTNLLVVDITSGTIEQTLPTADNLQTLAFHDRMWPGTWYIRGIGSSVYGLGSDIPVVADYTGDGKADIAVFRPSNSTWYLRGIGPSVYGQAGDIPVVADYTGDGKAEIAVFHPSNSTWYIRGMGSFVFGQAGDIPVVADYTGDGKADIAVFRPSNRTWYLRGIGPSVYGQAGDIPVVADYTGDGKAEIAVFHPSNSTWYIRGMGSFVFGQAGDIPVVADYTGDGKAEIAVFRPSNRTWYIRGIGPAVYGQADDIPVVADYTGDGKADVAVFRP